MCGIVAAAGDFPPDFLHDALKALEYRGYDSWGMAWTGEGEKGWKVHKDLGPPSDYPTVHANGHAGIAHTRWATHGRVCHENTHPVVGKWGGCPDLALVSNGIVSNAGRLHELHDEDIDTETDTEALAHFLAGVLADTHVVAFARAIADACKKAEGKFAFALIHRRAPDKVFLYARGAPMLIGTPSSYEEAKASYAASDQAALLGCGRYFALKDGHVGVLKKGGPDVFGDGQWLKVVYDTEVDGREAGKAAGSSVMAQEILEQVLVPSAPRWMPPPPSEAYLFGCGSSYNAALWGRWVLEDLAGVLTCVEYATEFSRRALLSSHDALLRPLFLALTQSGETRDVLDVLEHLRKGDPEEWRKVAVLTANPHSAAARLANAIDIFCGPETAVAATKSFTAQCVALARIAEYWRPGSFHPLCWNQLRHEISHVLSREAAVKALAADCPQHVFFLGSGPLYPIAREGALKLKEVAYVHAEAMPASEVKHGPLALVDEDTLAVFLMDGEDARTAANIEEIKTRGGKTLLIGTDDVGGVRPDRSLLFPSVLPAVLRGLVLNVALQLYAMHAALKRGLNPDRPRNLAKAVSV